MTTINLLERLELQENFAHTRRRNAAETPLDMQRENIQR